MADYLAIADAIAAAYASVSGIKLATARPPNTLPTTPAAIVWPVSGTTTFAGGRLTGEHDYRVAVHLAQHSGDVPRYVADAASLIGPCIVALAGQAKLGLSVVAKALVTGWQLSVLTYGGTEYVGLELTVRVWTEETVALTP